MKPIKIVLKMGRGWIRKSNRGVTMIKVHYVSEEKYHSEIPLYEWYTLIRKGRKEEGKEGRKEEWKEGRKEGWRKRERKIERKEGV
jgi:hypothetical protein